MTLEATPRLIAIGETMMMFTPARAESLASAWVGVVGDDVLGHRIRRSIERLGVDTRWVMWDSAAPTGVYFKDPGHGVLYYRSGSAASRMSPATVASIPRDEAQALWGCSTADDVRALLPEPGRLVVKDSDVGATEFSADGSVFEPAIPTEVLEAVGAGDAFAAGYLAALLQGDATNDRLRAGHERARLVLLSTSDFVAQPTSTSAPVGAVARFVLTEPIG